MKATVIGGGSTYTPELVAGFLARTDTFPLSELCLMDIDPKRLAVVGGFTERMVKAAATPFTVTLTTNQREAVADASYVLTQIRVGGMRARREDEYLGMRHGLIGQETTGIGGMAKALRTIPVIMQVAADIRTYAPGALLVNFTNPAGLVTQALADHAPHVAAVGVCNVPITAQMHIIDGLKQNNLNLDATKVQLDTLGLNHLTWHRGFTVDGEDMWPTIFQSIKRHPEHFDLGTWDAETLSALGMLPNYYLEYFYYTDKKLAAQQNWPPSRAEQVMEIEDRLLAYYTDEANSQPPPDLMERGGAYYSTMAAQLLNAHYNDLGETHVVNVPHRGAVEGWPADWVLEMLCRVEHSGITPLPADPLPPEVFGLIAAVKTYELLTVEAAIKGSREAAYKALLAHPLGPPADKIDAVLTDILTTNRDYLPQFELN